MTNLSRVVMCAALLGTLAVPSAAQNRFVNYETPQTHPIDVATVGGREFVLVCNTPDNSLEIYHASPPHAFVQRVPVGMGPASVRWNPDTGRAYVCNFDGDSVSVVRLNSGGSGPLATLERTMSLGIGDEPADIAFDPTNSLAAISLSSSSAVALVDPLTLASTGPPLRLSVQTGGLAQAVKMPRALAWLPDGRFFAANLRGGSPGAQPFMLVDIGLYRWDTNFAPLPTALGGLGTTNHAFAASPDGQVLFVVGTRAQNNAAVGVQAVSALPTGFVESWLMVVDTPLGGAMSVRGEATAGGPPASPMPSIDLNRDYSAVGKVPSSTARALVQPTDVLTLADDSGALSHIVLTAYHSDKVALLTPNASVPGGYGFTLVPVPPLSTGSYTVMGPRGLAYSAGNDLLFVNGRLDNSVAVIDPRTGSVTARFPLQFDPTPVAIRHGRQFLYSNRFSIDNTDPLNLEGGFVSCAACHVDGRIDGLPWDLGEVVTGPALQPGFNDPGPLGGGGTSAVAFPSEKGPMMTQTLQGLVNSRVNQTFQFMATNAPYHWRGDKPDFVDFNEAFVNLQGMPNIGTTAEPKGLTDTQIAEYRAFINTIVHPPNPEQDLARITPGALGPDPNDPLLATRAKLGMLLFHNVPSVGLRSCVDCHPLPDGSSNTATLEFAIPQTITNPTNDVPHPMESAGLRNIAQREMVLHQGLGPIPTELVANHGLLHPGSPLFLGAGNSASMNTFVQLFPGSLPTSTEQEAMVEFLRQFDTGTAPMAGFAYTVDSNLSPLDSGANQTVFDLLEGQVAEANVGLGVYTRNAGLERGYWFDVTATPPVYREEGTSNVLNRGQVLALAVGTDAVVIAQGTPLGTERRWASSAGSATLLTGNAPSNVTVLPMAPNTAYVDVASFNLNLNLNAVPPSSTWALRTLQQSVLDSALSPFGLSFGVPAPRHEPPRRFRVTGDDIRPGALMLFGFAAGTAPASFPIQILELEIFPTDRFTSTGERIWESEAEIDAAHTLALLNGGYWAPDVVDVLLRTNSAPNLDPVNWNHYLVGVLNEDLTLGASTTNWQRLRVQDGR